MNINHVIIPMGPSVADPSGVIKLVLIETDGTCHTIGSFGWRCWWRSFLVWAIRRHVRKITR
jgi:hypothetical protein